MADRDLLHHTLQFNNVVPLVGSAIMITVSFLGIYFSLVNRMNLIEQKQDQMLAKIEELSVKMGPLYTRVGQAEIDIRVLQTEHRAFVQ